MLKRLKQLVLLVEIVNIHDMRVIVVILKQVIGLSEGERFILILDDVTMSLINSVCGQFALFDHGCICIEYVFRIISSTRAHFIQERLYSWSYCHLLCRAYGSKYRSDY